MSGLLSKRWLQVNALDSHKAVLNSSASALLLQEESILPNKKHCFFIHNSHTKHHKNNGQLSA